MNSAESLLESAVDVANDSSEVATECLISEALLKLREHTISIHDVLTVLADAARNAAEIAAEMADDSTVEANKSVLSPSMTHGATGGLRRREARASMDQNARDARDLRRFANLLTRANATLKGDK